MTDKEILEAVKAEIERLHEEHRGSKGDWYYRLALRSILHFIKTLQVEPVKPSVDEAMAEIERKAKLFTEANKGKTSEEILAEMRGEEPVSEDFEMALAEMIDKAQTSVVEPWVVAAQWKDELIKLAKSEEPVSEDLEVELNKYIKDHFTIDKEQLDKFGIEERDYMYSMDKSDMLALVEHFTNWQKTKEGSVSEDLEEAAEEYAYTNWASDDYHEGAAEGLPFDAIGHTEKCFKAGANWQKAKDEFCSKDLGEYINELSKQFPEVSFAKLSRITVRVAKWQKEHLWKPADGNDLPIIDREVIALLDNGKVVFAHRPPEFWDGKNIITGKVTRNYPKTYDKGGWNIPNVKYWLDCLMPKEIEL